MKTFGVCILCESAPNPTGRQHISEGSFRLPSSYFTREQLTISKDEGWRAEWGTGYAIVLECIKCEKALCKTVDGRKVQGSKSGCMRFFSLHYSLLFCLQCPCSGLTEIACELFSVTVPRRLGSEWLSVGVALSSCDHETLLSHCWPHRTEVTRVGLALANS